MYWFVVESVCKQHHTDTKTSSCNLKFRTRAILRHNLSEDRSCVKLKVTGRRLCVGVVLFSTLCEPVYQVHIEHSFGEGGHRFYQNSCICMCSFLCVRLSAVFISVWETLCCIHFCAFFYRNSLGYFCKGLPANFPKVCRWRDTKRLRCVHPFHWW